MQPADHESQCPWRRIVHAEPDTVLLERQASVAGFGGAKGAEAAALVECGICLDALEEVAVNGCCHKLCGTSLVWCFDMCPLHVVRSTASAKYAAAMHQRIGTCLDMYADAERGCLPLAIAFGT